ncbi:MAG: hypothetical protein AAF939_04130 [Planctomycetota bacterium]
MSLKPVIAIFIVLLVCPIAVCQESKVVDPEVKALHDKLSNYLSGTRWTGKFVMDGLKEPREEQYEIISAEKNEVGDYWNLVARIKYGGKDSTLPLPPIEIKFAGKTPVITVDRVFFPGFGTFDARVLIRQGKYAGTWGHSGGVGGQMFGKIEKMTEEEVASKKESFNKKMEKDKKDSDAKDGKSDSDDSGSKTDL